MCGISTPYLHFRTLRRYCTANKVGCGQFTLSLNKKPPLVRRGLSYEIRLKMLRNTIFTPRSIKLNSKIPMIGEKSIIPIGGINFLKKPKYGSHALANMRPNPDC